MLLVSISLLSISIFIYLQKRIAFPRPVLFLYSLGIFTSIFLSIVHSVADYFTGNGMTIIVFYYLKYGLSGAGFSEYIWLISVSVVGILSALSLSLWIFLKKHRGTVKPVYAYLVFLLLLLSVSLNPVTVSLKRYVFQPAIEIDENSEFFRYYHIPELTQTGETKNLIFIYAEGLERTYFDQTIFPNLTKNLIEIESESISFTNITQDIYSHHTIGGMVASQCGIPLISPSHANSMSGMDTYLRSVTCIGDLLDTEGYYLSYYGGADLDFAGKGKFYYSHKFNEVKGREELLPELENAGYRNSWGLFDDSLLDLAYERFSELSESQDRFALFLLTMDTHHPKGFSSDSCKGIEFNNNENSILTAAACSDNLIAGFIEKIRQSEYSNKTVLVLASDHLAMQNTAADLLKKSERKNLFLINTPDSGGAVKIDRPGLTIDICTTVLPFIGYTGDIGLGRDILKSDPKYHAVILNKLDDFRPDIIQFWDFPRIKESLKIDMNHNRVFIDNRGFNVPLLIELNDRLETTLKFKFDPPEMVESYLHISNMEANKSFILIDKCEKLNHIFNSTSGLCLLGGKTDQYVHMELTSDIKFSPKEIREIAGLSEVDRNSEENKFI